MILQKMFFESSKLLSGWRHWRCLAVWTASLGAIAVALVGGGPRTLAGQPATRRVVVATTTVVADLVRQVGGERITVDSLMGPGIDPHSYKATPRDTDRLSRADLVVASGLHLEGKLSDILSRLGKRVPMVAVADALPRESLLSVAENLYDPHVWFDAKLWSQCPAVVAQALAAIDPAGREQYEANANAYRRSLELLDGRLRDRIATIPQQQRVLVTAHDAFRYFGRAYGIEVVGVQGTSTESEAGLNDINRLVELLVVKKIPAVFVETSVSDRNMTALREGASARGHAVTLGGRLYSDSLGGPDSDAATLEQALVANVETIVAGLSGGR
ncbi:MAG: zinc ABC transporter substrate-binding protein [Planctomycetia bacterium]|nr:zinc ABC transporter substrate-binding protein [Planctomycetia bacterium]